jgi:tetratricopeptide (TPR) repeat protein
MFSSGKRNEKRTREAPVSRTLNPNPAPPQGQVIVCVETNGGGMIAIALLAAALLQEPDPAKDLEKELDRILAACAATEEKFTLGAAGECLQQARLASAAAERSGDAKAQGAIAAMAIDRVSKAVSALESRSSELRRVQNQLERGRKRAAAAADESKRAAALRYAIDRATLVVSAASGETADLVNLGLEYSRAGDWEEAEDALAEAESKLPLLRASTWETTAEAPRMATLLLARVRAAQGRIKEAAEGLRQGLERMPSWLEKEVDFKESLHAKPEDHAKFIKSLEGRGDDPDALLLLGHERFFSPEERPKSKELFDRVIRKRPNDSAAKAFLKKLSE